MLYDRGVNGISSSDDGQGSILLNCVMYRLLIPPVTKAVRWCLEICCDVTFHCLGEGSQSGFVIVFGTAVFISILPC